MASSSHYRVLMISTAVAPLGSGLGGGVELFVKNAAQGLQQRGHHVTVLAPAGSVLEVGDRLIPLAGQYQPTAHTSQRDSLITMPATSVLGNMLAYAHRVQGDYDVILHFCYDWLPFY
ncbi:MAG TPA: glycosyltransferase, partial [Candidatus Obscuribacterales bacterium]